MKTQARRASRAAALLAAASLVATAVVGVASPAPQAHAAPGSTVTITPNPSYQGREFTGWGTSLVWFANATGEYPEEIREELYNKVFGPEGMNLNIARYNVGGGNATDVPNYLRPGAAVQGWWAPNDDPNQGPLSTLAERDAYLEAWDPNDPASYNWDADQSQRWWVDALAADPAREDMVWEAFSNSPPYFMTNSGFVTGGFKSTDEQVRTDHDAPAKFADYLAQVVSFMEDTYNIDFTSVDPFNEPCTGYWGTPALGPDGYPTARANVQEGAQICPGTGKGQQQNIIRELSRALDAVDVDARVAANDETNPQRFNDAWANYDAATRELVEQVNVHTYGTNGINQTRDIAKANDLPLWMSEVGGDFMDSRGFDPVNFSAALGFAQKVIGDLRDLEPDNYVFWQEIEDYYNMEKVEKLNWGSVFIDFDCNDSAETAGYSTRRLADAGWESGSPLPEEASCKIVTNSKFNAMRNFTHYITPGSHLIGVDDPNAVAAVTPDGDGARIVYVNPSKESTQVRVDLSNFATVAPGATLTPVVTTEATPENLEANALVEGTPVKVASDKTATVTVPGASVTTFVIDQVSGVAEEASLLNDGDTYQFVGRQSGKMLTASGDSIVIDDAAITSADAAKQLWTVHRLDDSAYAKAQRFLLEDSQGRFLGVNGNSTDLRAIERAEAAQTPETTWILNSKDTKYIGLLNASNAQVLDVNGGSSASGTSVGTWMSNSGHNQQWAIRSIDLMGFADQRVNTAVGIAPTLPSTVTPIYRWGHGEPVPVTWKVDGQDWSTPGTVTITGSGTDVYGNEFDDAQLSVDVGPYDLTDPTSITVPDGISSQQLELPETVTGRQKNSTGEFQLPVTWNASGLPANLSAGIYSVEGSVAASDNHGRELPAKLTVIVTEGTLSNVLVEQGTSVTASYSEASYFPENTINGNRADKAWSTWGSGRVYERDTLTFTLPQPALLDSGKVFFYRDGDNKSWADSVQIEYRSGDEWVTLESVPVDSSTQPVTVEFPLEGVLTDQVRVHMDAKNYLTVSEVELYRVSAVPASVTDLASLRVNGEEVDLSADSLSAAVRGSGVPSVIAVPLDSQASVESVVDGDRVTVTVTAADGVATQSYTVDLQRVAAVESVTVDGQPVVGKELQARVETDPTDATVDLQWLRDGAPIQGATSSTYQVTKADQGTRLSVEAVAKAEGYLESEPLRSHSDGEGLLVEVLSSDNSLKSLIVGSSPVPGFNPDTAEYTVITQGSTYPAVSAIANDDRAQVSVDFDDVRGVAVVTVTAENGDTRVYRVTLKRQVVLSVSISGGARVGDVIEAQATTDPRDATVSYTWLLDGQVVGEPQMPAPARFTVTKENIGKTLTVQANAAADAFLPAEAVSEGIVLGAAPEPPAEPGVDGDNKGDDKSPKAPAKPNPELVATGLPAAAKGILGIALLALVGGGVFLLISRRTR